jgi:hypothetical protein
MDNVGIFYIFFEYFTALWYILWQFGIICGHLVYFSPFRYVCSNKNLATLVESSFTTHKTTVSWCTSVNKSAAQEFLLVQFLPYVCLGLIQQNFG